MLTVSMIISANTKINCQTPSSTHFDMGKTEDLPRAE
jgi:hypothetical protein